MTMLVRAGSGGRSPRSSLARLLLVAAFALEGCSLVVGTSGLSGGETDGGASNDAPTTSEGGGAVDASAFVPCSLDGSAAVLRVLDPTAGRADATAPCNPGNVLVTDDKGTGLDVLDYGRFVTLDRQAVTGCIGVEFGTQLKSVTVRMRAVGNACGRNCGAGECGQGRYATALHGATLDTLESIGTSITVTADYATYPVQTMPEDRIVVICRPAYSADKDDIEVDSIVGGCNP